jgi:hypothetical protein
VLIEPVGKVDYDGFKSPIPFAADESVRGLAGVQGLVGRFWRPVATVAKVAKWMVIILIRKKRVH